MRSLKLLLCGAASYAAVFVATPGSAQVPQEATIPSDAKSPPTHVSALVVTAKRTKLNEAITATKTDAPPMDTPINVQIVTLETLRDQAVTGLDQALRNVSGVTVGAGGGADNGQPYSSIFLRGFSTDAHFRDGVRLDSFGSDSGTETTQFSNIESVAVLKGPAAILYGAVEPGGIVNIITKQPQATPAYSIEQQVGSYAFYRTAADATGSITRDGSLLYRMDASYENSGSPTQFIYNHTTFIAPVVTWQPDPHDLVKLELEFRDVNFGQNYGYEPQLNGAFINTSLGDNYAEPSPDRERTVLVGLSWSHAFNEAWSLKAQSLLNNVNQWSAGVFPLYIDTAADQGLTTPSGLVVGRALNQVAGNDYTVSENLDLVGHFSTYGLQHTLLFGGDFVRFAYMGGIKQAGQIDSNISWIDAYDPAHPGTPFTGPVTPFLQDNQQINSSGVYLQDQVKLPLGFILLAGGRFQYVGETGALGFLGPLVPNTSLYAHAVTPRLGLLWRPRQWLSLYTNYSGNFGPSNGAIQPNGQVAPPTTARSWEVGAKTEFAGGRVVASLDYYDLTKTNLPTADPANPNFVLIIGAARSTGVEFDLQGQILPGWNVVANFASTDARVTQASNIASTPAGTPLGEVPKSTAHLWTTYDVPGGPLQGLKVGGGITYTGAAPYLYEGLNPPNIAAWQTVDLMASYGFTVQGRRVTAQINATNILDRRYFTDIQAAGFPSAVGGYGGVTALYGQPRTIIGSIRVGF